MAQQTAETTQSAEKACDALLLGRGMVV